MYEYQVLLMGGVPVFVDTYPDFRLREEALAGALSKRTKFIVINSPNNPTGRSIPKKTWPEWPEWHGKRGPPGSLG